MSVTINGKSAYVYFISPTQINVQAPAEYAERHRSGGRDELQRRRPAPPASKLQTPCFRACSACPRTT